MIERRMPYKVDEGFFEMLENNVAKELGVAAMEDEAQKKRRFRLRMAGFSALVAAACMALVFVLSPKENASIDLQSIDQAYANLSEADQNFLLEVYQEDVFMDE